MEKYRLERGNVVLGVVTRGAWDGQQGSWHDWGWLAPSAEFQEAEELLVAECQLHDEATRSELEGGDPTVSLADAERLQRELMRPGVSLVSLADGSRWVLAELHAEAGRLYWR